MNDQSPSFFVFRDHDVPQHGGQIIKGNDATPYPHVQCCAGCQRLHVCHGCGFPVRPSSPPEVPVLLVGHPGTRGSCPSGACARCCGALHKHPQG
jgi:hypothetical protein